MSLLKFCKIAMSSGWSYFSEVIWNMWQESLHNHNVPSIEKADYIILGRFNMRNGGEKLLIEILQKTSFTGTVVWSGGNWHHDVVDWNLKTWLYEKLPPDQITDFNNAEGIQRYGRCDSEHDPLGLCGLKIRRSHHCLPGPPNIAIHALLRALKQHRQSHK